MAIDLSSVRTLTLRVDTGLAYEALLGLGMARSGWAEMRHTGGAGAVPRFTAPPAPLTRAARSVDSGPVCHWFALTGLATPQEARPGVPPHRRAWRSVRARLRPAASTGRRGNPRSSASSRGG